MPGVCERRRLQKREASRRYYATPKGREASDRAKWASLLRKYGLSPDGYHKMFLDQGEVCAACGSAEPRGGRWHIDHDHDTGNVRGILCLNCNVAIGMVGESIDTLLDIANYLKGGD